MAYAKNTNRKKFHPAKTPAQKVILTVIILAIIAVFASLVCIPILSPENQTKSKISHFATNYYENYFYPKIFSGNKNMAEVLGRYTNTGFSRISLRQIFLSNPEISDTDIDFLVRYCDENSTTIQFFPEAPYDKTSYRVEYTYSCSF